MKDHQSVGQAAANVPGASHAGLRDGPTEAGQREDAAVTVRERIAAFPRSTRLPTERFELYIVRDFLTPEECAQLIALIDANRIPSPVVSDDPVPAYRTSETCYLYPADPVAAVEARLDRLTGIDAVQGELLQGQRYAVGQEFKPHHDFFHTNQLYWREQVIIGGQRTWTAMAFLNEPEAGGQTNFPSAGIMIAPKPGNLLVWNNMDALGSPNEVSLHQGMPVELGVKYILTKWYRERRWGS
ncbi:prolyl hydroxylase family protein [Sphingomonas crusticola]|uniref:prolyl hydroxylase family protein n=1 Tax=Sphingomonas crusticola TaxID=1697973 RepID=UPI000E283607|nr:2OG-Fe(II) oxygenase [Sphingomonas crusticola]